MQHLSVETFIRGRRLFHFFLPNCGLYWRTACIRGRCLKEEIRYLMNTHKHGAVLIFALHYKQKFLLFCVSFDQVKISYREAWSELENCILTYIIMHFTAVLQKQA